MRKIKFLVYAQLLMFSGACVLAPATNADIVSTQQLAASTHYGLNSDSREKALLQQNLNDALNSAEVEQKLVSFGVKPEAAKARIANMTDAEAQELAAKMDELPAGGDVVLLLVVIILVLLLR